MTATPGRDRLVSVDEACRICGLGRSALYERLAFLPFSIPKWRLEKPPRPRKCGQAYSPPRQLNQ